MPTKLKPFDQVKIIVFTPPSDRIFRSSEIDYERKVDRGLADADRLENPRQFT